jgi:iron complex outermembrane receptor protein
MLNALFLSIKQGFISSGMARHWIRIALASPMLCGWQMANAADTSTRDSSTTAIAPVAVTANPLGVSSDALVTPVSILNGRELSLRRESTLGETLNGIPGISST